VDSKGLSKGGETWRDRVAAILPWPAPLRTKAYLQKIRLAFELKICFPTLGAQTGGGEYDRSATAGRSAFALGREENFVIETDGNGASTGGRLRRLFIATGLGILLVGASAAIATAEKPKG
jgi:hypothetical protein